MCFSKTKEMKGLSISLIVAAFFVIAIVLVVVIPHPDHSDSETTSLTESSESELNKRELFIATALQEVGTVGGIKYAEWYTGFDETSAWCAIFVSWCAGQANLIHERTVPKYALVTDYVAYYEDLGKYFVANGSNNFEPRVGDLAFFDWEDDGQCDHIGIVVSVSEDGVYVVNGNNGYDIPANNIVKNSYYALDFASLVAYARPEWK